ncbi:hypothetical protein B0J12DRAFT_787817 [Macrophomina phaseolina]|uniref:Short-chain dehydrogenase/reductase SDR n=1 Tax=Macrophomina phaseolina TaxID=35725 RepID=A0ABQ8G611_9PEZI|nr:hypothetical protein B0J12DRAFT_787817 [Macrophomina phaseolina]
MAPAYGPRTAAAEVAADFSSNIRGKTILTTGETIDATAAALRKKSPDVALRSVVVDLGSLASVRRAADQVVAMQRDDGIAIDALMLNASIMACPYRTTADGLERQFGTNHLGHFVFAHQHECREAHRHPGRWLEESEQVVHFESFQHNGNPQGFAEYWEQNLFKTLEEGTSTHVVAA